MNKNLIIRLIRRISCLEYLGFGFYKSKQWKKPKAQIKNLIKCGYSIDEAKGLAYCRKGYMYISHSKILQNAITKEVLQNPNKKLGRRGLVFALEYYLA